MPTVHPPAKVLVSGATGGLHRTPRSAPVTSALSWRGDDVRGTVRSRAKGEWLARQVWAKAGSDKFEYVVVEDVVGVGAFDDAVKDIAAIAHTASPVILSDEMDPSEIVDPTVNGTVGILNSALEYGSAVRRVVITSSVAALHEPAGAIGVFTEEDWNQISPAEIESKGAKAEASHKYCAAKTMAEKAVWKFVEEHKGETNFEVTTVLPALVYGPIIHEVPSPDKFNLSIRIFYDCVRTEVPLNSMIGNGNYVDVRDLAAIHIGAVERDEAAGQRIILSAGLHTWQDVYDALNTHVDPIVGVPVGTPGAGKSVLRPIRYVNEKAKTLLGVEFRSLDEMSYDTLNSLKERGFWP